MSLLGMTAMGDLIFNARPHAGTQTINPLNITHIEVDGTLGNATGRDDMGHYLNKVVR